MTCNRLCASFSITDNISIYPSTPWPCCLHYILNNYPMHYAQQQNYMRKANLTRKSSESFRSINQAQTNRSLSKQTHAFSKSPRFQLPRPTCQEHFYAGQQIKTRRSGAGIGYSSKSDFTKVLTCSPGTARYHIKSQIQEKVDKKKGFQMGLGRDKLTYGEYISRELTRTPSADKYKISLSYKNKAPTYSIRPRTKMINKTMTIDSQNDNPGPADYENPQIKSQSRFSSKFATISYGTNRTKRFQNQKLKSPGPGAYQQISKLSTVGRYIVSRDRGGTIAKIGKSRRVTMFDEISKTAKQIPGAGTYQAPSQFGQYDRGLY